jgi:hypothetical protein
VPGTRLLRLLLLLLIVGWTGLDAQTPSVDDALQRASAYLREWVPQLANVVATETFDERRLPQRRRLKSDLLLVQYPGGPGWMMFRDVLEADGRQLTQDPERLVKLFTGENADAREQALRISAEGVRYHLAGATSSATNPLLGIALIQDGYHPRLQFRMAKPDRTLGEHVQGIHFEERDESVVDGKKEKLPLLLPDAGRVSGTVWLDVETGTIVKTEALMSLQTRSTSVTLFARDERLGIMVPKEMRTTWGLLTIDGFAEYSNYRRFGVSSTSTLDSTPR